MGKMIKGVIAIAEIPKMERQYSVFSSEVQSWHTEIGHKDYSSKMTTGRTHGKLASLFLLVLATSLVARATQWNLSADYSTTVNPTGQWAYGWEPYATVGGVYEPTGGFTLYNTAVFGSPWGPHWYDVNHWAGADAPLIWKNLSSNTGWGVYPGNVSLHPGLSGEFSVVQWTAPNDGTYWVNGSFGAGDSAVYWPIVYGSMSYYVVSPNGTLYWLNDPGGETFSFSTTLTQGETIDFAVGYNTVNGYYNGNTPVAVNISDTSVTSAAPEPGSLILLASGTLSAVGMIRKKVKVNRC